MKKLKVVYYSVILTLLLAACGQSREQQEIQSYTSGKEKILVDESFAPIVEDQAYVFESTYKDAKLELINRSENELVNMFMDDSAQVAILSRPLSKEELRHFESKNIKVRTNRFAVDGIALITHRSSPDSTTLVSDIIKVLQGKPSPIGNLVFDNANSSTVRYFRELAGVKVLPEKGVYALKSNAEVIGYVHDNPGTIGVVGVNWIVQPPADLEDKVSALKILGVKNIEGKPGSDDFYKPNQNDIALELYPLTRALYIVNCEGGAGLGTGFASFIAGERGQRIVLKSGLLPDSIPPREINIIK